LKAAFGTGGLRVGATGLNRRANDGGREADHDEHGGCDRSTVACDELAGPVEQGLGARRHWTALEVMPDVGGKLFDRHVSARWSVWWPSCPCSTARH
jgi:hypothetical protein